MNVITDSEIKISDIFFFLLYPFIHFIEVFKIYVKS